METTRARIRRLMDDAGIRTVRELAESAGIVPGTLYQAMCRGTKLSYMSAQRIGRVLGVRPEKVEPGCLENIGDRRISKLTEQEAVIAKALAEARTKGRQICWDCRNAVPEGKYGCEWSRHFKPVPGWIAEETGLGYRIASCPKFIRDEKKEED